MFAACEAHIETEPETIFVGQDRDGHWLVQASGGWMEGRFISLAAAMRFARSERGTLPASCIRLKNTPMEASVSFAPVQPWERAVPKAAKPDAPRVGSPA